MFKNIIIAILVLSNLVFLIFALYQKAEAERMAQEEMAQRALAESSMIRAEKNAFEARAAIIIAKQTSDSLRNELAKIQK